MFERDKFVTLLANDIYAALLVKYRFSREAMDAEKEEKLSLEKEIAEVIFERIETFPIEEMAHLWLKNKSKELLHVVEQFREIPVDRHLDADRLESNGIKQPWKRVALINQRLKSVVKDLPEFDSRQFKHRHQNSWITLRSALSEYRLALGDLDLTRDMSVDEIRQAIIRDGEAVEKILNSMLEIGMTREERDWHLNSVSDD